MKKQQKDFFVDIPPEKMARAMRDPEHIERNEKKRDALEVNIKDIEKTDKRHVYEIHSVNYSRSIKGVDRTKTENVVNRVTWDLEKLEGNWKVAISNREKVSVTGGYKVAPDGAGSKVTMYVSIDIRIPLVGKVAERIVEGKFVEEWPKYIKATVAHANTL